MFYAFHFMSMSANHDRNASDRTLPRSWSRLPLVVAGSREKIQSRNSHNWSSKTVTSLIFRALTSYHVTDILPSDPIVADGLLWDVYDSDHSFFEYTKRTTAEAAKFLATSTYAALPRSP